MYMNLGSRAGRGWRLISAGKAEIGSADREIPPGTPIKTATTIYRTWTTLTTPIPLDDSVPRHDEGTRIQSLSVDIERANSRLLVEWTGSVRRGVPATHGVVSLFLNDEGGARGAEFTTPPESSRAVLSLATEMIPGSAGVHTVHANVGPGNVANPLYLNGATAGRSLAGSSGCALRVTEIAGEVMTWAGGPGATSRNSEPQSGTLSTPVPGLTNYTVGSPNGGTPTEAELATHRYRHHSHVAEHNGRVWVANSSGGTNEDAGGQMTVVASSLTSSISFSAPILVVPAQSTFSGTGASYTNGTRITYPRCFTVHEGKLYLVAAIDEVSDGETLGIALVACECNDNGTIGPLFRISTESYTPASGVDAIAYDAVLGPPLFAHSKLYGRYGGSRPPNPEVSWANWAEQAGASYAAPCTIDTRGDGSWLVRIWRRVTSPSDHFWGSYSTDGGETWSSIRELDIPNSPANCAGERLPDGRIVLVGNMNENRDPLWLAIFDGEFCVRQQLYYVRQGVQTVPTYPGEYKGGGAQYPGVWVGPTDLWVSYSIAKETIGVTRIPLSGL